MFVRALVLAVAVGALAASPLAQTPVAAREATVAADEHLLENVNGEVRLDGRTLPGAAPAGLDLSGFHMQMAYSGPVTPVVEIDGRAFDADSPLSREIAAVYAATVRGESSWSGRWLTRV